MLSSQSVNRSFDSEKIEEYRSKEEYDYFKRKVPVEEEQEQNSSSSSSYSHNSYSSGSDLSGVAWVIIIIILIALLVIIVMIALNADGRSSARSEVIRANTQEIEEELDEEEIDRNDFDSLIQKAKNKGNFRLAIRLMFLKSLQILDEKKLIKYKKNKTNYEYTFEIKNQKVQGLFQEASDTFSWVWYGSQDLDTNSYNELEPNFNRLIDSIEKK